jgi:hypothetical protein
MALNIQRLVPAAVVAAFLAIASLARPGIPKSAGVAPELTRLTDIRRRVTRATNRVEALTRRDSVLAMLPTHPATNAEPVLVLDRRLPAAHRSLIERAVKRQWASLRLGTSVVPVVVAVVVDTVMSPGRYETLRGEYAFDYILPTPAGPTINDRCITIVSLHTRNLVNAESRGLSELVASPNNASRLLGPCALFARFGQPGPEIARWLRARDYDLATYPRWYVLPATAGEDMADRWRIANTNNADMISQTMWLSPEATGCAAGSTRLCASTILGAAGGDTSNVGALIMMNTPRDSHWRLLAPRYLSDLVTALGPDDFARFWQSTLSPNAALVAVAGRPLDVWTHQWAVGLIGEQRVGPAVSFGDVAGAFTLAGLSLMIAAWGWSRRQVR